MKFLLIFLFLNLNLAKDSDEEDNHSPNFSHHIKSNTPDNKLFKFENSQNFNKYYKNFNQVALNDDNIKKYFDLNIPQVQKYFQVHVPLNKIPKQLDHKNPDDKNSDDKNPDDKEGNVQKKVYFYSILSGKSNYFRAHTVQAKKILETYFPFGENTPNIVFFFINSLIKIVGQNISLYGKSKYHFIIKKLVEQITPQILKKKISKKFLVTFFTNEILRYSTQIKKINLKVVLRRMIEENTENIAKKIEAKSFFIQSKDLLNNYSFNAPMTFSKYFDFPIKVFDKPSSIERIVTKNLGFSSQMTQNWNKTIKKLKFKYRKIIFKDLIEEIQTNYQMHPNIIDNQNQRFGSYHSSKIKKFLLSKIISDYVKIYNQMNQGNSFKSKKQYFQGWVRFIDVARSHLNLPELQFIHIYNKKFIQYYSTQHSRFENFFQRFKDNNKLQLSKRANMNSFFQFMSKNKVYSNKQFLTSLMRIRDNVYERQAKTQYLKSFITLKSNMTGSVSRKQSFLLQERFKDSIIARRRVSKLIFMSQYSSQKKTLMSKQMSFLNNTRQRDWDFKKRLKRGPMFKSFFESNLPKKEVKISRLNNYLMRYRDNSVAANLQRIHMQIYQSNINNNQHSTLQKLHFLKLQRFFDYADNLYKKVYPTIGYFNGLMKDTSFQSYSQFKKVFSSYVDLFAKKNNDLKVLKFSKNLLDKKYFYNSSYHFDDQFSLLKFKPIEHYKKRIEFLLGQGQGGLGNNFKHQSQNVDEMMQKILFKTTKSDVKIAFNKALGEFLKQYDGSSTPEMYQKFAFVFKPKGIHKKLEFINTDVHKASKDLKQFIHNLYFSKVSFKSAKKDKKMINFNISSVKKNSDVALAQDVMYSCVFFKKNLIQKTKKLEFQKIKHDYKKFKSDIKQLKSGLISKILLKDYRQEKIKRISFIKELSKPFKGQLINSNYLNMLTKITMKKFTPPHKQINFYINSFNKLYKKELTTDIVAMGSKLFFKQLPRHIKIMFQNNIDIQHDLDIINNTDMYQKLIFQRPISEAQRKQAIQEQFNLYKELILSEIKKRHYKKDLGFTQLNIPTIQEKVPPPQKMICCSCKCHQKGTPCCNNLENQDPNFIFETKEIYNLNPTIQINLFLQKEGKVVKKYSYPLPKKLPPPPKNKKSQKIDLKQSQENDKENDLQNDKENDKNNDKENDKNNDEENDEENDKENDKEKKPTIINQIHDNKKINPYLKSLLDEYNKISITQQPIQKQFENNSYDDIYSINNDQKELNFIDEINKSQNFQSFNSPKSHLNLKFQNSDSYMDVSDDYSKKIIDEFEENKKDYLQNNSNEYSLAQIRENQETTQSFKRRGSRSQNQDEFYFDKNYYNKLKEEFNQYSSDSNQGFFSKKPLSIDLDEIYEATNYKI